MRAKSLALLVLALGCGLVASIGITQAVSRPAVQSNVAAGETTTVLVALKDLEMGDALSPQLVKLEQWPKDKVPPGALAQIGDVEGRRTKMRLFAGEPILESKLYGKNEVVGGATARIPPGYRAVAVSVDDVSGGSNLILPGERVDVLVFVERKPDKGIQETSTKTVLQDIKVFAVNNNIEAQNDGEKQSIKAKTIMLLVTPDQAAKLTLASELGRIRLVLRRPDDDVLTTNNEARPTDFLGGKPDGSDRASDSGANIAPKAEPPKDPGLLSKGLLAIINAAAKGPSSAGANAPSDPANPRWTVRILQPGAVNDVVMELTTHGDAAGAPAIARWQVLSAEAPKGKVDEPTAAANAADPAPISADPLPTDGAKTGSPAAPPAANPALFPPKD